jgi:hypothetical protein
VAKLGVGLMVIAQKPCEKVVADLEGYRSDISILMESQHKSRYSPYSSRRVTLRKKRTKCAEPISRITRVRLLNITNSTISAWPKSLDMNITAA